MDKTIDFTIRALKDLKRRDFVFDDCPVLELVDILTIQNPRNHCDSYEKAYRVHQTILGYVRDDNEKELRSFLRDAIAGDKKTAERVERWASIWVTVYVSLAI